MLHGACDLAGHATRPQALMVLLRVLLLLWLTLKIRLNELLLMVVLIPKRLLLLGRLSQALKHLLTIWLPLHVRNTTRQI